MKTLTIHPSSINTRAIDTAARALEDGEIVVCPTDTLYALVCDALNPRAIERLCRIKGINPDKNCLSIICPDMSVASEYVRIDNRAYRIIKDYLPGPYTFILPAATTLPRVFKGRKQVGLRIPSNPIVTALAEALGHPLLVTSVNIDDQRAEAIAMEYAHHGIDLVIDGGEGHTAPSTIVDLTDPTSPILVRPGAGPFEE